VSDVLRLALALIHVGVAAVWVGSMLYSLGVVQPAALRFFGAPERFEDFAITMASGARWKVIALIGALALSGAGLTVLDVVEADALDRAWLGLVGAKAVLLVAATATFAAVSWRLWPARLFAPRSALEAVQVRFRRTATGLTGLVGVAFVLGVVTDAVGPAR
jgi:uncharacterized membrane protein